MLDFVVALALAGQFTAGGVAPPSDHHYRSEPTPSPRPAPRPREQPVSDYEKAKAGWEARQRHCARQRRICFETRPNYADFVPLPSAR